MQNVKSHDRPMNQLHTDQTRVFTDREAPLDTTGRIMTSMHVSVYRLP